MINLHPLEVVGRGSETQTQVGKKINYLIYFTYLIYQFTGYIRFQVSRHKSRVGVTQSTPTHRSDTARLARKKFVMFLIFR